MDGQLKAGTMLTSECGNIYKVVKMLGAGGQGEVYDVTCNNKHYALNGTLSILRLLNKKRS